MKKRGFSPEIAEVALRDANAVTNKRLTKSEQKRFKRFQKGAKKVGLLVSRSAYELYFRSHLIE